MIIGIDGNEANVDKRVGIGEYSFELLRQFSKYQISNIKYQIYLKDKPREDFPKENETWRYRIVKPHKLWTQIALPFDLYFHRPRPDIFFTPSHYAPRFAPMPAAISIMDISYIHFPELFKKSDLYQLVNWTKYSVKKASVVFTISQASKNDIIEVYKVPENKVVVTYPGIKEISNFKFQISNKSKMQNLKLLKEKYGIEKEYILFVGTLQPRKNIVRFIEAFSRLVRGPVGSFPPASAPQIASEMRAVGNLSTSATPHMLSLVVVGKKGWMYKDILNAPQKFGVKTKVKFLHSVPDDDLPNFYKNAICFALPSLYEGFGLPVLEAMKYGCPVLTSNISSLPEAGGNAVLYCDPEDVDDITKNLELITKNLKLREELVRKGYEQVKKFSWEKTARETLQVLEQLAKSS